MIIDIESSAERRRLESRMKSRQEKKDKGVASNKPNAAASKRISKGAKGSQVSYKTIISNHQLDSWVEKNE